VADESDHELLRDQPHGHKEQPGRFFGPGGDPVLLCQNERPLLAGSVIHPAAVGA